MSKKDEALEKEKRIKEHLLTLSKEQIIELYLQVKFERDYLETQYIHNNVRIRKQGENTKYLEISRMQANSILKCGGAISIGIYRGVYGQEYIQEIRVENESLDDAETRIMTELPDNLHYAFKYFEIWAGKDE